MSQPLVSIVIPTHDRGYCLPRALNSVLQQDFEDWELWIVNDGSRDATTEIIDQWLSEHRPQQKVSVLNHAKPLGVSAARNKALTAATGQWVAFLDSDDEWLPNKLSMQLQLTDQHKLVHGEEIWMRNGVRVNPGKKHTKGGGRQFSRCVDLCCISPSTVLIELELLKSLKGFREDFPVCEDFDLWLRICCEHEVGFISQPVVIKYGGHPDQLSTRYKAMDYYRVKALFAFLDSSKITDQEKQHVAQSITQRCQILLNGYRKHNQTTDVNEVESWMNRAKLSLLKTPPVAYWPEHANR